MLRIHRRCLLLIYANQSAFLLNTFIRSFLLYDRLGRIPLALLFFFVVSYILDSDDFRSAIFADVRIVYRCLIVLGNACGDTNSTILEHCRVLTAGWPFVRLQSGVWTRLDAPLRSCELASLFFVLPHHGAFSPISKGGLIWRLVIDCNEIVIHARSNNRQTCQALRIILKIVLGSHHTDVHGGDPVALIESWLIFRLNLHCLAHIRLWLVKRRVVTSLRWFLIDINDCLCVVLSSLFCWSANRWR